LGTNSAKVIKARRERIALYISKGLGADDIVEAFAQRDTEGKVISHPVSKETVLRDIKAINGVSDNFLSDLARVSLAHMYDSCLLSYQELIKQAWGLISRQNPEPGFYQKAHMIKIIGELTEKKAKLLSEGPQVMELKRLQNEIQSYRNGIEITV
jgi:hypothetical protein